MESTATRLAAFLVAFATLFVPFTTAPAETYRGIFWNLESGESEADTIADQMAVKGAIDFWGLSEVPNQTFLDTLVAKINTRTGITYTAKLSDAPSNADKLAIIFNPNRLTSEPYSGTHTVDDLGDNFFEVDTVQISSGLRPSLGVQLKDAEGQSVVVLVNHWKAFGSADAKAKRKRQAEATDVFITKTVGIPVVVAGDLNMPVQAGGTGLVEPAFAVLDAQCDYLKPINTGVVGTHKSGSVLDAVWVANELAAYDSKVTILNRDGNALATTRTFSDSAEDTDHRPLLLTIESDAEQRIESLKEDIAALEEVLERMKLTLQQLEAAQ